MADLAERVVAKLRERLESGVIFVSAAYANRLVSERLVRRYFKDLAEPLVGFAAAAAAEVAGEALRDLDRYVRHVADAAADFGAYMLAERKLMGANICYFTDANTIECRGFDVDTVAQGTVEVYVDDQKAGVSAVKGDPGGFTLQLSTPVARGWHKLLVVAGEAKKDSFSGRVYTP